MPEEVVKVVLDAMYVPSDMGDGVIFKCFCGGNILRMLLRARHRRFSDADRRVRVMVDGASGR